MSFYIKFDDVEGVDAYARSKLSDMTGKLEGIWKAIEGLAAAPGFEGAAADKAKEYLSGVHGLLYGSIQTILIEYQQLLLTYKDGYHTGVDSDPHAEFDEDRLLDVEELMGRRARDFEAQAAELEAAVGSVSDLLSFFGPRNGAGVAADVRQIGVRAMNARDAVGQYEASHLGDLVSVRDQVGQIGAVLDQYCGAHGSMMTSFDPVAFGQNPAVIAMSESYAAIAAGQQARAGDMEGVYAREGARAEVLDAEAARERAKWGWIKAVGAVVTIAVGVVVIVATAGAATPLIVLGAAAASTLFGASDLVEAGWDIYYGSKGDAYTQAFNPLRDTVFGGDQTMYDVVGFGVCAVASAGIPIGLAARAGAVTRIGGVARASLREGIEDLATQKATEWATPYLGAEAALAAGILAGGSLGKVGGGSVPKAPGTPPKTGTGGIPKPKTPDVPKPKTPDVPKVQPVKAPDVGKAPSSTPVRGDGGGAPGGGGVVSPSHQGATPDGVRVDDAPATGGAPSVPTPGRPLTGGADGSIAGGGLHVQFGEAWPGAVVPVTRGLGPRTTFPHKTFGPLEPNTCYEVPVRGNTGNTPGGRFYTDDNGQIMRVETDYGPKGGLNPDLLKPLPNCTYVIDGRHTFTTDELGRTVSAHIDGLDTFEGMNRSKSVQGRVGDEGGKGYDGGHLIANMFGGGPEDINLVAMTEFLNRSQKNADNFYALERQLESLTKQTPTPRVELTINISYPPGGGRVPDEFEVSFAIDGGAPIEKRFSNDRE